MERVVSVVAKTCVRRPNKIREKPMEVLCLGLPRSGTDSLSRALKILGYDHVYHGATSLTNLEDWVLWNKAGMAKYRGVGKMEREDWDRLLGNCMAVSDMPCVGKTKIHVSACPGVVRASDKISAFIPELLEAYPEAKVVLTTRPFEAWYESMRAITLNPVRKFIIYALAMFHPETFVMTQTLLGTINGNKIPARSREALYSLYQEHNAMVRGMVPKERLLEYHVKDGWEPLCTFLNKKIPSQAVPRGNSTAEFQSWVLLRQLYVFRKALRNISILAILIPILVKRYQKRYGSLRLQWR